MTGISRDSGDSRTTARHASATTITHSRILHYINRVTCVYLNCKHGPTQGKQGHTSKLTTAVMFQLH